VASSKYYFLNDKLDNVNMNSVICNGVEFEPLFEARLLWILLTLILFIKALNSDDSLSIEKATSSLSFQTKKQTMDITNLIFSDKVEFEEFLFESDVL
jgi:hypothetical protein